MEGVFTHLIVGAGSAGCVLAARLTENQTTRVCLIEAGRDIVPGREPDDVKRLFPLSTFNSAYSWPDLRVHWRMPDNSPALPFQQGKILGGGSSIMGMWALRGVPEDYDGWAADGAAGWDWESVLPYFRKLETDIDCDGPLHGKDGPLPIRRRPRAQWSRMAKAGLALAEREGTTLVEDMNADFRDGHCTLPISRYEQSRASAGISYLTEAVRQRKNLTIVTDAEVVALIGSETTIRGVRVRLNDGTLAEVDSRETIVCAGAVYSPALLLRSGIGPASELAANGITVLADRPGVGKNLQNHPFLPIVTIDQTRRPDEREDRPPADTYLRWSSGEQCGTRGDLGLYIRSYLVWHALGQRLALLAPVLMKPRSRGYVRLAAGKPHASPEVAFNFFDDPADLPRMVTGLRRAAEIGRSPEFRAIYGEALALSNAGRLSGFNSLSIRNGILGWLGAKCFDVSPSFGMRMMGMLADMRPIDGFIEDDSAVAEFVVQNTIGTNHVSGTCRMGKIDDPMTVVDTNGLVIGFKGLRVADASIMPTVPSGNTHLPTVMVAEKIADAILASHGGPQQ